MDAVVCRYCHLDVGTESDSHPPARRPTKRWLYAGSGIVLLALIGAGAVLLVRPDSRADGAEEAGTEGRTRVLEYELANEGASTSYTVAVTVGSLDCGLQSIPVDEGLEEMGDAEGELCLVGYTIENRGNREAGTGIPAAEAVTEDGRPYDLSIIHTVIYNEDEDDCPERIEPGARAECSVIFDVPPGTKLSAINLRMTVQSQTVLVPL